MRPTLASILVVEAALALAVLLAAAVVIGDGAAAALKHRQRHG